MPVGGSFVPAASVSVTVAVQLEFVVIGFTRGLQLTDVDVLRLPTVSANVPELVLCVGLPLYEP